MSNTDISTVVLDFLTFYLQSYLFKSYISFFFKFSAAEMTTTDGKYNVNANEIIKF